MANFYSPLVKNRIGTSSSGGGASGDVNVLNFPSVYPLSAAQVADLKDIRDLDATRDSVTVSGSVELGAATLAALEETTVLQGGAPWSVTGAVELGAATLAALESITVTQGTSPWVVSGTVALDAATLSALENVTVTQGTDPWTITGSVNSTDSATASIDGKTPDLSGTWSYAAGVAGTANITGRVLQITASAGLTAASLTINAGPSVTIPAGRNITIKPEANLVDPTIVFTGTVAYFVEMIT